MNSISWPKMFSKNVTLIKSDDNSVKQNLKTLVQSEQGGFLDDPYYGVNIKKYMFDQNNYVLKDILIDDIYTQVASFMPQLKVERKNINVVQDGTEVKINMRAINQLDFKTDMYNIVLFDEGDKK